MTPQHEALFLPIDEDSLLFQICFYYGLLIVFLEVVVPLLFQRRVRLFLPNVLPQAPVLSDDAFQQQKTQLATTLRELQRASSAAKKRKQRRKYFDALGKEKTTPRAASRDHSVEQDGAALPPSGLRVPSSTRALSTGGKSAKSSRSSSGRELGAKSSEQGGDAMSTELPPSKLQQPSQSFFVSATAAESTESMTSPVGVASSSAPASRQSSGERPPAERRQSTGGSAKASISDTQQRQVQRERRRYSWQNASEEDDEELSNHAYSHPSPSQRGARGSPASQQRANYEATFYEAESQQELHHGERGGYGLADYDDEEEPEVVQRSVGRFAPTHQSLFDDSDEEFLTVIRRPRTPAGMAPPSRTSRGFGNEQMDVERTISAAFGGRPLGGASGFAAATHYQPVTAAAAAVAPPPPVHAAQYHQVNMYEQSQTQAHQQQEQHLHYQQQHHYQQQQQEQQRNQFITGRRESPAALSQHEGDAPGAANYREVPRDKTPRIIRKIAFDEEMMALAATPEPSAASLAAGAKRKRKRSKIFSPEDESPDFSRRRTRL